MSASVMSRRASEALGVGLFFGALLWFVALVSYTPVAPGNATVLGADPGATIVNVVTLFQLFFQAFGALACLFAVLSWHASMTQRSNRSGGSCGVQFLFGVALINVLTVSQWVVNTFRV